ncbi:MAG TPA: hypothetical protein VLA52_06270 [Thermohalobaculum sp.]|nr:hypothetical protein [Thermohalobaculum sp.]
MTAAIVVILRVIGLIWAIGSVFIMRNARAAGDSDAARWVFVGGVLTFAAGLLLAAASRWAVLPAVLLAVQQALFHWRQAKLMPPDAPRPNPAHVAIATMVALAAAILAAKGALI